MRRLPILAVLCACGCSLLFDPSGIVAAPRDAAEPERDLHSEPVDDLSVGEDLAKALDLSPAAVDSSVGDLATIHDLSEPDLRPCVPGVFRGFQDGGSKSPFDCNACGCTIDPLDNAASVALKLAHGASATFGESFVPDGGLFINGTNASELVNGDYDYLNSPGRFYLDGDFDLELDYQAVTLPPGAHFQLYALGPLADMGLSAYSPEGILQIYNNAGADRLWLYSDARTLDVDTTALAGTMRIRRTGSTLCTSVVGHEEECHTGTSPARPYVQIEAIVTDPSCGGSCFVNYKVRVAKLRLLHGSLVAKP